MDERYTLPVGDTYSPTVEPPPPTVDPTSSGNHIGAHEALASWYGPELQGSPTASGEPFDPYGYTCAHKTLPFGTQLLVSYEGKTVQVTVNDRGPYIDGRELDLSQGAADALGLTQAGVGYVEISYPGEDSNVTGPGVPAVETYTPTNTYDVYTPTNTYDMYAPMVSYDLNTPVSPGEEILATQDPEEMNQEFGILHDDNPDVW
ncbi:MAG: septal ring lytic transglycosylase RlpA family protein [Rubrobacter sp.]|nr:septal ring lytic transglycosylase RlpA family protein [Rubrobacter sp.]